MRPVSSVEPLPPPISVAINKAIEEVYSTNPRYTNRYIADALGVSEQAIGRWRSSAEPTRDQLADLERLLDRHLGYISKLAGYFEDGPTVPRLPAPEQSVLLDQEYSESDKTMLVAILKQVRTTRRAENKRQAEWNRLKRNR